MALVEIMESQERGRSWYTTRFITQGTCLIEDQTQLSVRISENAIFTSQKLDLCCQCYFPFQVDGYQRYTKEDCSSAYDGYNVSFCNYKCLQTYEGTSMSLCKLLREISFVETSCSCEILRRATPEVRLAIRCLVLARTNKEIQDMLNFLQATCSTKSRQLEMKQQHHPEFEQLKDILCRYGDNVVLESEQYLCVVLLNGFGLRINVLDINPFALALFSSKVSFLNHSCGANSHYIFEGRTLRIYASRCLEAHEEVNIPFIMGLEAIPKEKRKAIIGRYLHFDCQCNRCILDDYTELDYLLAPRMNDLMEQRHKQLWILAETCYAKAIKQEEFQAAWELYTKIIDEYVIHQDVYHPFDPISLERLDRLVMMCWIFKGYG
jgi:hypothetical protein